MIAIAMIAFFVMILAWLLVPTDGSTEEVLAAAVTPLVPGDVTA